MKWTQQYTGPFLILEMLSPLTAKIQKSAKTRPLTVHIDKLKAYWGDTPKSWVLPDDSQVVDVSSERSTDELRVQSRSDYVTHVDAATVARDDSHTITVAAEVHRGFDDDSLGGFQLGNLCAVQPESDPLDMTYEVVDDEIQIKRSRPQGAMLNDSDTG